MSMRKNALAALCLCSLIAACPPTAYADQEFDNAPLVQTIQWLSTDEKPSFPQTWEQGGVVYELAGESTTTLSEEVPSVPFSYDTWEECAPDSLQQTVTSFAASKAVSADGYEGEIPLTSTDYVAVQAIRRQEVNYTQTFPGLPSNDAVQIPATLSTQGTSGSALTLTLASLSWAVDDVDANGLPASYTATGIYRGVDEESLVDRYRVTAHYEGTIFASEPVVLYETTARYRAPDAPLVSESPASSPLTGVLLAAAAAAAAAGAVGVVFWRRGKDVRIARVCPDGLKVAAAVRSKRGRDGALEVELPARFDAGKEQLALLLRKDKASGAPMRITQARRVLRETTATQTVWL